MTKTKRLPAVDFERAAECLKVLAHPARLALLQLLLADRRSVGELADACELAPNVASEHLKLLERCGLLDHERDGRQVFYRVVEPEVAHILACVEHRFATGRR